MEVFGQEGVQKPCTVHDSVDRQLDLCGNSLRSSCITEAARQGGALPALRATTDHRSAAKP